MTTTASEHGWPLEIDFKTIPQRIMNFETQIFAMISNFLYLKESAAWKTFLTLLNDAECIMADFQGTQWDKFRAVGTNAHAG
jgi:hypothetical protein